MTNEEFIQSITLQGEEWRDVVGYEGLYMVSSIGRIAAMWKTIYSTKRTTQRKKPKLMKQTKGKHSTLFYYSVNLYKNINGKSTARPTTVHRIVANSFLDNPNGFTEVDHINGNSLDNRVENLRWCSHSTNMSNEHAIKKQSISQRKKRLPMLYKPVVRISENGDIKIYESVSSVAKDGFHVPNVISACKGRHMIIGGYRWEYASEYQCSTSSSNFPE